MGMDVNQTWISHLPEANRKGGAGMKGDVKKVGLGLEVKTIKGKSGRPYLVFRTQDGNFHIFREVNAKKAARDCGAGLAANDRGLWQSVWKKTRSK